MVQIQKGFLLKLLICILAFFTTRRCDILIDSSPLTELGVGQPATITTKLLRVASDSGAPAWNVAISGIQNYSYTSLTCTFTGQPVVQVSYRAVTSNLIVFTLVGQLINFNSISNPTTEPATAILITGFSNPLYSGTQTLFVFFSDSNGVSLKTDDMSNEVKFSPVIIALTSITQFALASVSTRVYSSDGIILKLTPSVNIPANSVIKLTFPYNWDLTSLCCPIITGTVSCASSGSIVNSACVSSSPTTTTRMITITTNTLMSKNTAVQITINGLQSPPSMSSYSTTSFSLLILNSSQTGTIYNVSGGSISSLTTTNSMTVQSATFSTPITVNSVPTATTPTLDVSLLFSTPVSSTGYSLVLNLPFSLQATLSNSPTIIGSGVCNSAITSYSIAIISSQESTITFTAGSVFQTWSQSNGQSCTLKIPYVTSAKYEKYSGSVSAWTYYSGSGVDYGTSTFSGFNCVFDALKSQSMVFNDIAANQYLGKSASHRFDIELTKALSPTGFFIVDYVNGYLVTQSSSVCVPTCSTSSLCATATCAIDTSLLRITVTGINGVSITSTNILTVSLSISNLVNPLAVRSPSTSEVSKVSTYFSGAISDGYLVQQTSVGSTTINHFSNYLPIVLSSLAVSTTATVIRENVGEMSLTFTFAGFSLPVNSKYLLTLPTTFSLVQTAGITAKWSDTLQQLTYAGWNSSTYTLTFTSNSAKSGSLIIVISGSILLPASSNRLHTFALQITDTSDQQIASGTATYYVKSPDSTFSSLSIEREAVSGTSAKQNGEISLYTFTITNPKTVLFRSGYLITLTLPVYGLVPLTASGCTSGTTDITGCTNVGSTVKVQLVSDSFTTSINFKMKIVNLISFIPGMFAVTVSESESTYQIYTASTSISNDTENVIDFRAEVSSQVSDEKVVWTVTLGSMTPTNHDIPVGSKVTIDFPTEFSLDDLASPQVNCQCSNTSFLGRKLTLITTSSNLLVVQISNIYNPGPYVAKSDQFRVSIADPSDYRMSSTVISSSRNDIRYVYSCSIECKTCDSTNPSKCLTCYSDRFFENNTCVTLNCSDGYYQSSAEKKCLPCENNCAKCSSSTVCITCQQGFFFMSDKLTCVSSCSSQGAYYQADSTSCAKCDSKCLTCTSQYTCQTCSPGSYKIDSNSSCVSDCAAHSLFAKGTKCVECESPCAACVGTYNTCSSCIDTLDKKYLQGTSCQTSCNSLYYFDNNRVCQQCDSQCLACSGTSQHCTSCITTSGYYDNRCYATCPSSVPLNISGICTACPTNCSGCTTVDTCDTCKSSYYMHKKQCVSSCPTNYIPDSSEVNCILKPTTDILIQNYADNKFVPFPFTIALVLWIPIAILSKLKCSNMFLAGSIFSIASLIEFGSWITFFLLQYSNDSLNTIWNKVAALALAVHYLFNIIHLILYCCNIRSDKVFQSWLSHVANRLCNTISRILSIVLTHKLDSVIYSRLFDFSFLSAKLTSTKGLFSYNILSGVSLIFVSAPMIYSASMTCYNDDQFEQLFIEGIEVIIITILMIILGIANVKKSETFFETEQTTLATKKMMGISRSGLMSLGIDSERPEFDQSNRSIVVGELERPLVFFYEDKKGDPLNDTSKILDKSILDQTTDLLVSHSNNAAPLTNTNAPTEIGALIPQKDLVLKADTFHSAQQISESYSQGRRIFAQKQYTKENRASMPILEQYEGEEEDDEQFESSFGQQQVDEKKNGRNNQNSSMITNERNKGLDNSISESNRLNNNSVTARSGQASGYPMMRQETLIPLNQRSKQTARVFPTTIFTTIGSSPQKQAPIVSDKDEKVPVAIAAAAAAAAGTANIKKKSNNVTYSPLNSTAFSRMPGASNSTGLDFHIAPPTRFANQQRQTDSGLLASTQPVGYDIVSQDEGVNQEQNGLIQNYDNPNNNTKNNSHQKDVLLSEDDEKYNSKQGNRLDNKTISMFGSPKGINNNQTIESQGNNTNNGNLQGNPKNVFVAVPSDSIINTDKLDRPENPTENKNISSNQIKQTSQNPTHTSISHLSGIGAASVSAAAAAVAAKKASSNSNNQPQSNLDQIKDTKQGLSLQDKNSMDTNSKSPHGQTQQIGFEDNKSNLTNKSTPVGLEADSAIENARKQVPNQNQEQQKQTQQSSQQNNNSNSITPSAPTGNLSTQQQGQNQNQKQAADSSMMNKQTPNLKNTSEPALIITNPSPNNKQNPNNHIYSSQTQNTKEKMPNKMVSSETKAGNVNNQNDAHKKLNDNHKNNNSNLLLTQESELNTSAPIFYEDFLNGSDIDSSALNQTGRIVSSEVQKLGSQASKSSQQVQPINARKLPLKRVESRTSSVSRANDQSQQEHLPEKQSLKKTRDPLERSTPTPTEPTSIPASSFAKNKKIESVQQTQTTYLISNVKGQNNIGLIGQETQENTQDDIDQHLINLTQFGSSLQSRNQKISSIQSLLASKSSRLEQLKRAISPIGRDSGKNAIVFDIQVDHNKQPHENSLKRELNEKNIAVLPEQMSVISKIESPKRVQNNIFNDLITSNKLQTYESNSKNKLQESSSDWKEAHDALQSAEKVAPKPPQKVETNQIYDPNESVKSESDCTQEFMEISPSDFNFLNQRYEGELQVIDHAKDESLTGLPNKSRLQMSADKPSVSEDSVDRVDRNYRTEGNGWSNEKVNLNEFLKARESLQDANEGVTIQTIQKYEPGSQYKKSESNLDIDGRGKSAFSLQRSVGSQKSDINITPIHKGNEVPLMSKTHSSFSEWVPQRSKSKKRSSSSINQERMKNLEKIYLSRNETQYEKQAATVTATKKSTVRRPLRSAENARRVSTQQSMKGAPIFTATSSTFQEFDF